eukprot:7364315-Lingulodinium_polyedra.AAC.1
MASTMRTMAIKMTTMIMAAMILGCRWICWGGRGRRHPLWARPRDVRFLSVGQVRLAGPVHVQL